MDSNIQRTNKIFNVIKSFENLFREEFEKCDIKKCGHCKGTGLRSPHDVSGDHCSICGGMGYKGFKKLAGQHVCRTCNGGGCHLCNFKGTVDWTTYATGRDIIKRRD